MKRSSRRHKPKGRARGDRLPRTIPIPPFPPPLEGMLYLDRSDCSKVQTPDDQCPTIGQALQLHRRKALAIHPTSEELLDLEKLKRWFLTYIAPVEPAIYSVVLGRAVPPAALPPAELADPAFQQQLQALTQASCAGAPRSREE